jgi:hypothetical protein
MEKRVQRGEQSVPTVVGKTDTPLLDPPVAERLNPPPLAPSFLLRQRHAPVNGPVVDILIVDNVTRITFNGDTYEYLYYITSLVLEKEKDKLSIYRCAHGRFALDNSDEWKKVCPGDAFQGGMHLVEYSEGNSQFSLSS